MSGKCRPLILLAALFGVIQASESVAQNSGSQNSRRNAALATKVGFVPKHLQVQRQNRAALEAVNFDPKVTQASHIAGEPQFLDTGCDSGACGSACGGSCGGGCCGAPGWPGPVLYGRIEYLLWSTKEMDTPALVTTSLTGTAQEQAGVLGQASTSTLFGGEGLTDEMRSGGRFILGMWVDASRQVGIEFTHTALEEEIESFSASNFDESIVARPFFNLSLGEEDSRLIAFPSLVNGTVDVSATTEFQTFDITRRKAYVRDCATQIDHFIGYRYAELKDSVRVGESTISLADPTTDTAFRLFDQFRTTSEFYGGVTGLRIRRQHTPQWSVELMGKVGLGNTRSRLSVNGATTTTNPDGTRSTRSGGVLTQESNIGNIEDNEFSNFSELGISLHHQMNCGVKCFVGYSFMYWSDVLRAGNSIDSVLNPTQIPPSQLVGEARPAAAIDYDSFYAQGLRLGLEFGY